MASKIISKGLKRTALSVALGMCFTGSIYAQSNTTGNIAGQAASGDTVIVDNAATGFHREVSVGADGNYRVSALQPGTYTVTVKRADGTMGAARTVTVNVGTTATATTLGTVTVQGGGVINPIDVSSVESSTIMTEAQIDRLPVARDVTNVALLAPGTVRGDSRFGNLASFGGSSVAENVYYVNGFNVTNIVTGTAFNEIPFEAVAEQQVKTGGYGAEFGRSLGGVINIITKRGTNEWKLGANAFWAPEDLAEGTPLAYDPQHNGNWTIADTGSTTESIRYNVYGSGPLIKDRLFFFGLYQGRKDDITDNYESGSQLSERKSPQYLVKLDWNITDNHLLELTAFNDTSKTEGTQYTRATGDNAIGGGDFSGTFNTETGGKNYIAKWTGYLTDTFTLSALYGKGEYSRGATDSNSATCPLVIDVRNITDRVTGCWVNTTVGDPDAGDIRKAWRIDGEWVLGDHTVKFGLDREEFETVDGTVYSGTNYDPSNPGGIYWRYLSTSAGAVLANGGVVPAGVTEVVRLRYFENGGTFLTKNSAWYLEDTWQITDNFMAYLGIRNEAFENINSEGGSFVDVNNTWAPRLGFSWDVKGDSSMKFFGNAGRYYIPVYANTNVRLAGAETDYIEFYTFSSIDPVTGEPVLTGEIGDRSNISSGEVPDPRTVVDNNLSPMFQDEYILGFQLQLSDKWSAGVRGIYRDLKSGMDDICDGSGAQTWASQNGYTEDQAQAIHDAIDHCFLTNPGEDLSANVDLDGTGELSVVNIPAEAIGMPKAERTYKAVELFFERAWDDKWFLQGSYTWAKSYGNTEGYVRSDNGQDDAGITTSFDYLGLTDGAYGYLPNDRRHSFRLFGAYQLTDEWRVGANLLVQSGRPINCFGVYPADGPSTTSSLYGVASFYCGTNVDDAYPSTLVPRGTVGRVPWVQTLDMQLSYAPKAIEGLSFRMDVRNIFDTDDYFRVFENYEDDGREPNPAYLQPRGFVAPRQVTFSVAYDFTL